MLSRRPRAIAVAAAAWLAVGLVAPVGAWSQADAEVDTRPDSGRFDQWNGDRVVVDVGVRVPGSSGSGGNAAARDEGSSGSVEQVRGERPECFSKSRDRAVPCTNGEGRWSNDRQCYVAELTPQPPASDPLWSGRHPDGAIYSCDGTNVGVAGFVLFWAPAPPAAPAAPPDPAVVARQAVEQMQLRAVDIGIVPRPERGSVGAVGMPVWLWVDGVGPHTWGPITRTASVSGYSVTATATVDRVEWSMGDGTVVTCYVPGRAWYRGVSGRITQSPDCGHVYSEQGNPYTVTATAFWEVSWSGIGQSGVFPLELSSSVDVVIGEIQVLRQ